MYEEADKRRNERVVRIATLMATQSDVSLPRMMKSKAELKATYHFLETPAVTYESLMRPHLQQTGGEAQSHQQVLLIQDTTDLNYSHHPKTTGLGPLKNQQQHGMLLQTVLAVEAQEKQILGIIHQEPFLRKLAPEQETRAQRLKRERESQVWEHSVMAIGEPPEGVEWIHVGDRESLIFTFFETCLAQRTHLSPTSRSGSLCRGRRRRRRTDRTAQRAHPCCSRPPEKRSRPASLSRSTCQNRHAFHCVANGQHPASQAGSLDHWATRQSLGRACVGRNAC
jgi:Transposase DNA-binding